MDNLREKVIRGLECCYKDEIQHCANCPYVESSDDDLLACTGDVIADAISLLKAQEPRVMDLEDSVPAVPLDKLCELLAEMYHCPGSGWPSSSRACHPGCPDEAFEKLCGTDCESYSDIERWRAFLTKWMEGLNDHG